MAKFREERDSENRYQMEQLKQKENEIKVWFVEFVVRVSFYGVI